MFPVSHSKRVLIRPSRHLQDLTAGPSTDLLRISLTRDKFYVGLLEGMLIGMKPENVVPFLNKDRYKERKVVFMILRFPEYFKTE